MCWFSTKRTSLSSSRVMVRIPLRREVVDITLCDKVCHCLAAGRWFSLSTRVSSTNKTDRHDITEILLKVALNTITPSHVMIPVLVTHDITGNNILCSFGVKQQSLTLPF